MGGIGRRITESITKFSHKDYENALIQIIIAIDATAKNEFPELSGRGNVGKRCKQLIRNNKDLLMLATTLKIDCEIILNNKTLDQILYEIVRTSLFHDGELPKNFIINKDLTFSYEKNEDIISVPYTIISALILCVVGSLKNINERIGNNNVLEIHKNIFINVNEFFGKKEEMQEAIRKRFNIA